MTCTTSCGSSIISIITTCGICHTMPLIAITSFHIKFSSLRLIDSQVENLDAAICLVGIVTTCGVNLTVPLEAIASGFSDLYGLFRSYCQRKGMSLDDATIGICLVEDIFTSSTICQSGNIPCIGLTLTDGSCSSNFLYLYCNHWEDNSSNNRIVAIILYKESHAMGSSIACQCSISTSNPSHVYDIRDGLCIISGIVCCDCFDSTSYIHCCTCFQFWHRTWNSTQCSLGHHLRSYDRSNQEGVNRIYSCREHYSVIPCLSRRNQR